MRRAFWILAPLASMMLTSIASAVLVESYESGVGNVTPQAIPQTPTVQSSNLFATDGDLSAKFTMNGNWLWAWNTHNVLPSVADIIANQYLAFDFTVASGQIKIAGLAADSTTSGWKQQDAWSDQLTQPGFPGQILLLPTFTTGENRGYGTLAAGSTGTLVWDYKAAGFTPSPSDAAAQFLLNFQGPVGSVVHIDNLRVLAAPPQPPQFVEETIFSWETPDVSGTPVNEQFEGWSQEAPGFPPNQHIHSISSLGATDGASSLQIDRSGTASGFTWGSHVAIDGSASPENAALVDELIGKINGATSIKFDVRFEDPYPNTPTWQKFGLYVSDGTNFFDAEGASIDGLQSPGAMRTVSIPIESLDNVSGQTLADIGLNPEAPGLGFGLSVNTDGAGVYQIDNFRIVTEVPPATADFNGDSVVDAADLNEWTTGFGATSAAADSDADGDTDGADLLAWQRELGLGGAGASATVVAVPEPSAVLLLALVAPLASALRNRNT